MAQQEEHTDTGSNTCQSHVHVSLWTEPKHEFVVTALQYGVCAQYAWIFAPFGLLVRSEVNYTAVLSVLNEGSPISQSPFPHLLKAFYQAQPL